MENNNDRNIQNLNRNDVRFLLLERIRQLEQRAEEQAQLSQRLNQARQMLNQQMQPIFEREEDINLPFNNRNTLGSGEYGHVIGFEPQRFNNHDFRIPNNRINVNQGRNEIARGFRFNPNHHRIYRGHNPTDGA